MQCLDDLLDIKGVSNVPLKKPDIVKTLIEWTRKLPRTVYKGEIAFEITWSDDGHEMTAQSVPALKRSSDLCMPCRYVTSILLNKEFVGFAIGTYPPEPQPCFLELVLFQDIFSDRFAQRMQTYILAELQFLYQHRIDPARSKGYLAPRATWRTPEPEVTLFEFDPFLLGTFYYYLSLSACRSQSRPELIKAIQARQTAIVDLWPEIVSQTFPIRDWKDVSDDLCPGFQRLLEHKCDLKLSQKAYTSIADLVMKEKFLEFLVHSESKSACYGGQIKLFSNMDERLPQGLLSSAQVYAHSRSRRCDMKRHKITVFSIVIFFRTNLRLLRGPKREGDTPGHAMALIADHATKEIEFFEPNGVGTPWEAMTIKALQVYFNKTFPEYKAYTWFVPHQFCPRGIQEIGQRPMCQFYVYLWIYLRVSCPNIPRDKLSQALAKFNKESLDDLLQHLLCALVDFLKSPKATRPAFQPGLPFRH